MRVAAAIEGNLNDLIKGEMRVARKAVGEGLRESARGLHRDIKNHMRAGGFKGMARSWKMKHYRGGRSAFDIASLVYVRAEEGVRHAVWALEHGDTMRAKSGRYMLIPTGFNKAQGRRKSKDRVLVTPDQMRSMRKWTYVKPTKDGRGLVWFLRVTEAGRKTSSGRVQRMAFAGGMSLGGRNRGDVGSGRGRRVGKILNDGAVPMFILLPQVRIEKQTDIAGITRKWQGEAVRTVLRKWKQLDGK